MFNSKFIRVIILSIGLMLGVIGVGQAAPSAQDTPAPQIMLVMDVSDSMEEIVIPGNAPADLRDLRDRIAAIETDPEYIRLRDAIDAILKDPAIASLHEAVGATGDALNNFLAGVNYDEARVIEEIEQILLANGCKDFYATSIVYAQNLAEVDNEINFACVDKRGIADDQRQQIKSKMVLLENPEYQALRQADEEAFRRYDDARDALGYAQLREQIEPYDDALDDLTGQFEARAAEAGMSNRLELTQLAALTLVDLSRLDAQSTGRESPLGLVVFSTEATLVQPFTTDYDQLAQNINALGLQHATNIGEGLRLGLEQLAANANPGQPSALILFSDGKTNRGLTAPQVLAQYSAQAQQAGVKICTVGFGNDEAELDAGLLKGLAEATGGQYLVARSGEELAAFFLDCRQGLISDIAGRFTGAAKQGESVEAGQFDIGEEVGAFTLTLNYLNGDVAVELVDPQGNTLVAGSPNVTAQQGDNVQLMTVSDPASGAWTVRLTANQAPSTGLVYNFLLTTEQRPTSTPVPPTDTPTPTSTHTPTPPPTTTSTPLPTATPIPPTATAAPTATPIAIEQNQPQGVNWGLWGALGLGSIVVAGVVFYVIRGRK